MKAEIRVAPHNKNEEPIGRARRNIKKGEHLEIFIGSSGELYSEAIEFFNKRKQEDEVLY